MSFADVAAGDVPSLSACDEASLKLQVYQRQVALISRSVTKWGTSDVNEMATKMKYARVLQEEVAQMLARMPNENAMAKKKLCKDFENISIELEKANTTWTARETARIEALREACESAELEGDEIEFRQLEHELEHNEALIEEREEDLRRVHESVAQVHEIFTDLAAIVQEQQSTINEIESNIEETHDRTAQGLEQVKQAAQAQRGCCIQ